MTGINWWGFVGVVLVAYLVPGPDFAVVLRSAARRPRAGVAAAAGAQVGLCAHMVLAVVGLSVVLARHPDALTAIRVLGGAYLLYLGGRLIIPTLRRRGRSPAAEEPVSTRSAFAHGLFTNLLNPKAVLFFAAVLPQFVVPGVAPVAVQVAALGLLDVLLGVLPWSIVVALGVRVAGVLRRPRVRRWWDRVTGTALAGLGGGLVLVRE
ncbi:LysE family translocator [Pseudonocardia humida]|uniref:LysE family translocator n=1 Tax=Pseudonocardia humida TaxID=2800819 RepID=A0ABT1A3A1_9PSEU|nr:LysE family translocator [Pseudonocardia humida]MCO1657410.1 LysE family translocator [Pseudonocardia humida]